MTTAIAVVLMLAAVGLVAAPFLEAEPAPEPLPEDYEGSRADFEKRKLEAYVALRDAEMDYRMGKLSDSDYGSIKAKYTNQAIEALAALDRLPAVPGTLSASTDGAAPVATGAIIGADDGEIRFCPDCGTARPESARFCPTCGRGLLAAA
jgi:NADH pyrophosphatase NudC (nudix superfamily)